MHVFENTYGLKRFGICAKNCECNRCGKELVCDKCAYLSMRDEPVNCMEGGVQGCPFRVPLPEEEKKGWSRMTRKEAREKAEEMVFVNMNLGDIEEGCRKRGIKVTKNRSSMEGKLIEVLTEEYMK